MSENVYDVLAERERERDQARAQYDDLMALKNQVDDQLEEALAQLARYRAVVEAAEPFADESRIVAPSADPNCDATVVVTLAQLGALRDALATLDREGGEDG